MNKAYLLVICLLLTPFTGCVDNSEDDIIDQDYDLISDIEKLTEENKAVIIKNGNITVKDLDYFVLMIKQKYDSV